MSDTRTQWRPSVVAAIAAASVLVVVLVGLIVAVALMLTSPRGSEIVLDATWGNGEPLGDALEKTEDVIASRLENAGITGTQFYTKDDQIHIAFGEDADEALLARAAAVLEVSFSADFRPVIEAGPCDPAVVHTDAGPDREATLCDQEGFEQLVLGPSEIAATTITDVVPVAPGASTSGWGVEIDFDDEGTQAFASLTERLFTAGEGHNRMAIVLNGEVLTAPTVNAVISDGEVTISGTFTEEDAKALTVQLKFAVVGLVLSVDSTHLAT